MPTANEIDVTWDLILKIGAIIAVLVAIIQGAKYLSSITPTAKLANKVKEIEDFQKKDFEHLKEIDRKIENLEQKTNDTQRQIHEVNDGVKMLGRSQISLLRHLIDGNGADKMAQEVEELTDFFIKR